MKGRNSLFCDIQVSQPSEKRVAATPSVVQSSRAHSNDMPTGGCMDRRLLRRVAMRTLVVGGVAVASWAEATVLLPMPVMPIAEASVTADKHDDGKDKKDAKKHDDDRGEDF